jgi:hypothetical protein
MPFKLHALAYRCSCHKATKIPLLPSLISQRNIFLEKLVNLFHQSDSQDQNMCFSSNNHISAQMVHLVLRKTLENKHLETHGGEALILL